MLSSQNKQDNYEKPRSLQEKEK